uniref:Uncharacterized protein n=1 Tax=Anguilla anguilla TaxID=7936 RepID=A0A0E9VT34_ANGAN
MVVFFPPQYLLKCLHSVCN